MKMKSTLDQMLATHFS